MRIKKPFIAAAMVLILAGIAYAGWKQITLGARDSNPKDSTGIVVQQNTDDPNLYRVYGIHYDNPPKAQKFDIGVGLRSGGHIEFEEGLDEREWMEFRVPPGEVFVIHAASWDPDKPDTVKGEENYTRRNGRRR